MCNKKGVVIGIVIFVLAVLSIVFLKAEKINRLLSKFKKAEPNAQDALEALRTKDQA
jgi:type II secretory pathway pseudopilin PulG